MKNHLIQVNKSNLGQYANVPSFMCSVLIIAKLTAFANQ